MKIIVFQELHQNNLKTYEQDLARRDITINSIAQDVLTGELIDPFNGKQDIKNGVIRAITEHFLEDPLRVYRVARFAAMLNFEVDKATLNMMNSLKDELSTLSEERINIILKKELSLEISYIRRELSG